MAGSSIDHGLSFSIVVADLSYWLQNLSQKSKDKLSIVLFDGNPFYLEHSLMRFILNILLQNTKLLHTLKAMMTRDISLPLSGHMGFKFFLLLCDFLDLTSYNALATWFVL